MNPSERDFDRPDFGRWGWRAGHPRQGAQQKQRPGFQKVRRSSGKHSGIWKPFLDSLSDRIGETAFICFTDGDIAGFGGRKGTVIRSLHPD